MDYEEARTLLAEAELIHPEAEIQTALTRVQGVALRGCRGSDRIIFDGEVQ